MSTMSMRRVAPLVLVVPLVLGACQQGSFGPKTTIGGLGGAAAGGLIGAAAGGGAAGIAAGVLLGGLLGGALGNALDNADRDAMARNQTTTLETAPTGTTAAWQNPDSGNSGTFTPTRTFQDSSGQYCREFQQTIQVDGKTEQGYGTACRQADGSWKVIQ